MEDYQIFYTTKIKFWDLWDFKNPMLIIVLIMLTFLFLSIVYYFLTGSVTIINSMVYKTEITNILPYYIMLLVTLIFLIWLFFRKITLRITDKGLLINKRLNNWDKFNGFYIRGSFIFLQTKIIMPPYAFIRFLDKDRNTIRYNLHNQCQEFAKILAQFLPELNPS